MKDVRQNLSLVLLLAISTTSAAVDAAGLARAGKPSFEGFDPRGAGGNAAVPAMTFDGGADLTGPWRLFVDDEELLNMSSSVHRKYGQFEKFDGNPVAVGALYGSVLRTADGGYAMYHECGDTVCFSNSSDGIVWTNPKLGKEIRGGQYGPRNVLLARQGSAEKPNQRCTAANGTLAKTAPGCTDTQPSVLYTPWESSATYQMYNFNYGHPNGCKQTCAAADGMSTACHACMRDGYYRAVSNDGLHFTDDVNHNPVIPTNPPHQYGDVSSFVYDYLQRDYYATIKMFFAVNTTANYSKPRRSVGVSHTPDPTHWPQPTPSLVADEIDDRWASSPAARRLGNRTELYGLSAFAYQVYVNLQ
jgi:hypothetical protein